MSTSSSFKQSLRTATPPASTKQRCGNSAGTSTPTSSRRRTSPVARLVTFRRDRSSNKQQQQPGGNAAATPRTFYPHNQHLFHETEAEHFWKATLRGDSPTSSRNNSTNSRGRHGTPTRTVVANGPSCVVEHSHHLTAARNSRNSALASAAAAVAHPHQYLASASAVTVGFASDNVDPAEFARIEEMLVMGVYTPSVRIQKMETMLSRELAMWDHVVGNYNKDGNANNTDGNSAVANSGDNTRPPARGSVVAWGSPSAFGAAVSDAALAALMEINAKMKQTKETEAATAEENDDKRPQPGRQRQQQQQQHSPPNSRNLFSPPDQSIMAGSSSFDRSTTAPIPSASLSSSRAVTSPPRANAVRSAAATVDGTLQARAREKLQLLDNEVNVADSECQSLIQDLLNLQKRQQAREGNADELNELFAGVQRALVKSQERRERLVTLRKQLLAEM